MSAGTTDVTDLARRGRLVDAAVAVVLAFLLLGPMLLARGYALRGDMVFVPDQPWKGAWLGLDGRVPRFVPGDALVWAMGTLLPGDVVQKLLLLGALVLGGMGAGRLVARWPGIPRAAAITIFLWNPWVYERLAIGQWGVVVGYLLLPWTVLAAEPVRDGRGRGWAALTLWLAVSAVFSPASGLVALATALAVVSVGGRGRQVPGTLGIGLLVNLPWIVPSVLHADALSAPGAQFAGFAARAESPLGVVASLLSFGGIWKASVVPPERSSVLIVGLACGLVLFGLAGLRLAARVERRRVIGLSLVASAALLLALVTAIPAAATAFDAAASHLPALGILRDSHRYLGPVVLALLPGVAAATAWVGDRARAGRPALHAVTVLVVALPVLSLPSMAWGLHGQLEPVDYPREWFAVRDETPPGRMVVLPWRGGYRGFAWNDRRAVLDPAPRFFPGDVLIDDRLFLDGRTLGSEDPLFDDVRRALDSSDPAAALRRLGVRSVLVEKGNGATELELTGSTVLHDGPGLTLTDLGTPTGEASRSASQTDDDTGDIVIVTIDVLVLLTCATVCLRPRHRFRRRGGMVP